MTIRRIQVVPLTKQAQALRKDAICFCQTVRPVLILLKLCGVLPVTSNHQNHQCQFKRSWAWSAHSGLVSCLYVYQIIRHVDLPEIIRTKSLIVLLNHITNAVYALHVLLMLLFAFIKLPQYTKVLNESSVVFQHGLLCQSARRVAYLTQCAIAASFAAVAASQAALHYRLFHTLDVSEFLYRCCHVINFSFYAAFFSFIALVIGGFACFEKLLISSLDYVPVHPIAGVSETNNQRDFLGVVRYRLCRSEHGALEEFSTMSSAEVVEFLRICHERICCCINSWNCAMDPVFLVNVVLELAAVIVHVYAVVAHLVFTFKHPMAGTVHVLNCVFVFMHAYGLYLFLKNAQRMKNMVRGLTNFLLEYSTRISNLDEHQQVRLFIEKLKNHRPFTASGVFTIDLEIAGPISANILTYVLVALQFEIPEEE